MRKLATLMAVAALAAVVMAPNVAMADEVTILICNQEPPTILVRSCDSTDVTDCDGTPTGAFLLGASCVLALEELFDSEGYDRAEIDTYTQGKGQDIIYTLTQ